jgi:hypothetical protein
MPLVGAKAILLCSDDGNNVRAAQLWARTNEVRFATVRVRLFLVIALKVRLLVDSKETRGVAPVDRPLSCCARGDA